MNAIFEALSISMSPKDSRRLGKRKTVEEPVDERVKPSEVRRLRKQPAQFGSMMSALSGPTPKQMEKMRAVAQKKIGMVVRKKRGTMWYDGSVEDFRTDHGQIVYQVVYSDGEKEECFSNELESILKLVQPSRQRRQTRTSQKAASSESESSSESSSDTSSQSKSNDMAGVLEPLGLEHELSSIIVDTNCPKQLTSDDMDGIDGIGALPTISEDACDEFEVLAEGLGTEPLAAAPPVPAARSPPISPMCSPSLTTSEQVDAWVESVWSNVEFDNFADSHNFAGFAGFAATSE